MTANSLLLSVRTNGQPSENGSQEELKPRFESLSKAPLKCKEKGIA